MPSLAAYHARLFVYRHEIPRDRLYRAKIREGRTRRGYQRSSGGGRDRHVPAQKRGVHRFGDDDQGRGPEKIQQDRHRPDAFGHRSRIPNRRKSRNGFQSQPAPGPADARTGHAAHGLRNDLDGRRHAQGRLCHLSQSAAADSGRIRDHLADDERPRPRPCGVDHHPQGCRRDSHLRFEGRERRDRHRNQSSGTGQNARNLCR